MGSMITLGIGKMEIDWGKNNCFTDHSALFLSQDIKEIPYYYVDVDTEEPIVELKEGYSRKLSSIMNRLNLLGYTLDEIKNQYNTFLKEAENFACNVNLTFEEFYRVISNIDLSKVDSVSIAVEYDENGYDLGEYARRCILDDSEIKDKLYELIDHSEQRYYIGEFFENIDPYITLRILAENPNNADLELQWRFADVVENGWVEREEIVCPLPPNKRILLVTEGSSDSFILREAIHNLFPDIADFFDFVDMEENYPFTGAGNLYNFCLGLARIGIQNNTIVVFDNDSAGNEKYEQVHQIPMPRNLSITKLPECIEFAYFLTVGPTGESMQDINGKAVAIECFLDFNSLSITPSVRWTSYNKRTQTYQGELISKDEYIRKFKGCSLTDGTYDTKKLKFLINHLISTWINKK